MDGKPIVQSSFLDAIESVRAKWPIAIASWAISAIAIITVYRLTGESISGYLIETACAGAAVVVVFGAVFVWHLIRAPLKFRLTGALETISALESGTAQLRTDAQRYEGQIELLRRQLNDGQLKPHLVLAFDRIVLGERPEGGTAIFVTASIRNLGMPSIAGEWELTVTLSNGSVITPQKFAVRDSLILTTGSTAGKLVIPGDGQAADTIEVKPHQMLYEKAMTPIPQGGQIRGMLYFAVSDLTKHAFEGATLQLQCSDVTGRRIAVTTTLLSENCSTIPMHYPGTG